MSDLCRLIWCALIGLSRPRAALEAENLVLRHQLNVLRRKSPKRVAECPVDAIKPDTEPGLEKWLSLNAQYAQIWPNITVKKAPPPDSKEWEGKPDKLQYFSPNPGAGD